jgi:bacterioferritin
MKGDAKLITLLNHILMNELTAINQYFLHSKMFANWGYRALATKAHGEAIEEMKHAESLTERILFLEGLPNFQDLSKLMIGENPKEMLECDLKLEIIAVKALRDTITYADSTHDYTTSDMLQSILSSEEAHIAWLEQQAKVIKAIGIENYLQSQVS